MRRFAGKGKICGGDALRYGWKCANFTRWGCRIVSDGRRDRSAEESGIAAWKVPAKRKCPMLVVLLTYLLVLKDCRT